MKKRVIVELELELGIDDKDLTDEEIKSDIQKTQDQIGWDYYYIVKDVHIVNQSDRSYGIINMEVKTLYKWIEERPNAWTYELKCPKCGYRYSPKGYEDGTTDKPHKFCPECGEKLDKPKRV